jgi:hypothetical protein
MRCSQLEKLGKSATQQCVWRFLVNWCENVNNFFPKKKNAGMV